MCPTNPLREPKETENTAFVRSCLMAQVLIRKGSLSLDESKNQNGL